MAILEGQHERGPLSSMPTRSHLQHIPKPTLALACTPGPASTSPATTEPLDVILNTKWARII